MTGWSEAADAAQVADDLWRQIERCDACLLVGVACATCPDSPSPERLWSCQHCGYLATEQESAGKCPRCADSDPDPDPDRPAANVGWIRNDR